MTIYIAICDDNIADRKHLERLLEREKDARLKNSSDVMYIDSFGSIEALMHTPVKYDMFFVDLTSESSNGMDLAKELRKSGISAPIVLCTSTIDYKSYVNIPDGITIINKPLNAGQITHFIDVAGEWTKNKIPLLEIRSKKDTHFVKYTEVIKATPKAAYLTEICLSDGTYIEMADSYKAFISMCHPYNCFVECGKYLINIRHIKKSSGNGFFLSNGEYVKYNIFQKRRLLQVLGDCISNQ